MKISEICKKNREKMRFLWKIRKILTATLIRKTALDAVLIDGDGIGIYADGTTCRLTIGVTAKKKKSGLGRSLNKRGGQS